jgi:hypothetical protein
MQIFVLATLTCLREPPPSAGIEAIEDLRKKRGCGFRFRFRAQRSSISRVGFWVLDLDIIGVNQHDFLFILTILFKVNLQRRSSIAFWRN